MKNARFLLLVAGVTAAILALLLWQRPRALPTTAPAPAPVAVTPPASAQSVLPPVVTPASPPPPAAAPARVVAAQNPAITPPPPLPAGITAIQDQKTIDFSSGQAQVKNEAADKTALEAGLKEIEEATTGVTFGPNSGPPTLPGP